MTAGGILNVSALAVAVAGGAYFGFFSCGGYAWHKAGFLGVLTLCTIAALRFPVPRSRPVIARTGLVAFIAIGYFLSEATAAAFYPAAPESWSEFATSFSFHLSHGPC